MYTLSFNDAVSLAYSLQDLQLHLTLNYRDLYSDFISLFINSMNLPIVPSKTLILFLLTYFLIIKSKYSPTSFNAAKFSIPWFNFKSHYIYCDYQNIFLFFEINGIRLYFTQWPNFDDMDGSNLMKNNMQILLLFDIGKFQSLGGNIWWQIICYNRTMMMDK